MRYVHLFDIYIHIYVHSIVYRTNMKFVYFVEDALENLVKNVGKVKFASKII